MKKQNKKFRKVVVENNIVDIIFGAIVVLLNLIVIIFVFEPYSLEKYEDGMVWGVFWLILYTGFLIIKEGINQRKVYWEEIKE